MGASDPTTFMCPVPPSENAAPEFGVEPFGAPSSPNTMLPMTVPFLSLPLESITFVVPDSSSKS